MARTAFAHLRLAAVVGLALGSADRLITTDRKWPTAKAMKLAVTIEHI